MSIKLSLLLLLFLVLTHMAIGLRYSSVNTTIINTLSPHNHDNNNKEDISLISINDYPIQRPSRIYLYIKRMSIAINRIKHKIFNFLQYIVRLVTFSSTSNCSNNNLSHQYNKTESYNINYLNDGKPYTWAGKVSLFIYLYLYNTINILYCLLGHDNQRNGMFK